MSKRKGSSRGKGGANRGANVRVKHLTPTEVDALVKAAGKHSRYGKRDAALIGLSFRHGLRVSELCALRWDQIDMKAATMHIDRAKGGESNLHPLYAQDLTALRQLSRTGLPWVFTTERGGAMSPSGVRDLLRRLAPRAGLKRANPHSLRHACGFKLVNDGVNLPMIGAYLGHRDLKSTTIYTAIDVRRFRGLRF